MENQNDSGFDLNGILDNNAMHKYAKVKVWSAKHPQVHIHCVPSSATELNLVEYFIPQLMLR